MATTSTGGNTRQVRCPACDAPLRRPSHNRSRKFQCPKCREVIQLDPEDAPPAEPSAAAGPAEGVAGGDRIAALEKRVTGLEIALAGMVRAPSPAAGIPMEPPRDLQWAKPAPGGNTPDTREMEDVLVHNLSTCAGQEITIQSAAGDDEAGRRAEWLKQIFQRAHWSVRGPRVVDSTGLEHGLTFAVGAIPMADDAAAAHLALTASGLKFASRIDPGLDGGEPVLIVA